MIFVIKMMTRWWWWWWWWSQIDWAGAGCLQRADKLELWPLTSSPPGTFGCQKVGRCQCFQWLVFPCLQMSEYKRYWTQWQEQCGQNFIQTSNMQKIAERFRLTFQTQTKHLGRWEVFSVSIFSTTLLYGSMSLPKLIWGSPPKYSALFRTKF